MEKLSQGILWYLVFIFSTTFHEALHAFSAFKLGDDTAAQGGQVTLNPLPHLRREPVGTIVVPVLSFIFSGWMIGWASTPYNAQWAFAHPRRSAIMSLAGPFANLLLLVLAGAGIRLGLVFDLFFIPEKISFASLVVAQPGFTAALATFLSILFSLNLILFIFNLLPIPPLDGSGAIPLVLKSGWSRTYLKFIQNPAFSWLGILLAWKLFGNIFAPVHFFVLQILYFGI
jgi:Zn-dependent protease